MPVKVPRLFNFAPITKEPHIAVVEDVPAESRLADHLCNSSCMGGYRDHLRGPQSKPTLGGFRLGVCLMCPRPCSTVHALAWLTTEQTGFRYLKGRSWEAMKMSARTGSDPDISVVASEFPKSRLFTSPQG